VRCRSALRCLDGGVRVAMVLTIAVAGTIALRSVLGRACVFLVPWHLPTVKQRPDLQGAVPAGADWPCWPTGPLPARRALLAGLGLAVALPWQRLWLARPAAAPSLRVGSKAFTGSYCWGNWLAQQIRKRQTQLCGCGAVGLRLGGTRFANEGGALRPDAGYVEFNGTWASVLNQAPAGPAGAGPGRACMSGPGRSTGQRFDTRRCSFLGFEKQACDPDP